MQLRWPGTAAFAASLLVAHATSAAPQLRLQIEQKGDFALIGNTLAQDCAPGVPPPVVGAVGACGLNIDDTAPDVFWRSEEPGPGGALADTSITASQARSTAVLDLPAGAAVTHAFLYWAASTASPDTSATLSRPEGFSQTVPAIATASSTNAYQAVADVTALVQQNGPGAYRVADVKSIELLDADSNARLAGWWMVVVYTLPSDPPRTIALFDGLDFVTSVDPQDVVLSGLSVPPAFGQAKLGVVAYEGDGTLDGDQISFNGAQLSDPLNPANNFFNGSRTFLGAPVSVPGDLPQLTGIPESMSGLDLDVVDITQTLVAGQTSAPVQATSTGDTYHLAGFIMSIPALRPDLGASTKAAADLDGAPTLPGDTIEYTVVVTNDGSDTAIDTALTDPLPAGVTYVPGTLQIAAGAGAGPATDAPGDDACEYDAALRSITCRLGAGAGAVKGGVLTVGESVTVVFQVTVDAGFSGVVSNQALLTAAGEQGAPPAETVTDGNADEGGSPPTDTLVDACVTAEECELSTPHCNTDLTPNTCVECLVDAHCPGLLPVCDPAVGACLCVATGAEVCDQRDNDCDGEIDQGLDVGAACSAGAGACEAAGQIVCDANGAAVCDAVPGAPSAERCDDAEDSDCDGDPDNGCDGGAQDAGGCSCEAPGRLPGDLGDTWALVAAAAAAVALRRRRR